MDENYFRPSQDQIEKIVPTITSHSVTLDEFLENTRDKSNDRKFAELEKRITELENKFKPFIPITQYDMFIDKGASLGRIKNMTNEIVELKQEIKRLQNLLSIEIQKNKEYDSAGRLNQKSP